MDYQRFGNTIVLRIDPKEEVIETILGICKKENVHAGYFNALGASDDYDVCVFDLAEQKYYDQSIKVQSEITSCFGTISDKDGEPFLHVHMQAMKKDGTAAGGHLKRCVISVTLEAVITILDEKIGRDLDPNIGINVLQFAK